MRWLVPLVAVALLSACGGSDDSQRDRLALDGASSTALVAWQRGEGADAPGPHVVEARRDEDCYAVQVSGNAGGGGQVVVLRRPAKGDPVINGWEILGIRDDIVEHLNADQPDCGFS